LKGWRTPDSLWTAKMRDLRRPPKRRKGARGGHSENSRNASRPFADCSVSKRPHLTAGASLLFGVPFANRAPQANPCLVWPAPSRPRFRDVIAACWHIGSVKKPTSDPSEGAGGHPTNPLGWGGARVGQKPFSHAKSGTASEGTLAILRHEVICHIKTLRAGCLPLAACVRAASLRPRARRKRAVSRKAHPENLVV
jgi:hypothetical protein